MDKPKFIKSSLKDFPASEIRWVIGYAIAVILLTSMPYILAFQQVVSQSSNMTWRFSGFVFGVEDGNSYIAKMRRGSEGEWFFRTPYTNMEQKGVVAFLPYYLLGKFVGGKGSHEQFVVLFHWFRIGAGIFCIFATYRLLGEFLTQTHWRKIALVLITIGGGLGWLVLFFPNVDILPLEFYSPEAFGFLSLYGLPHLSLARAFLLLAMVEYLRLWKDDESQSSQVVWRLGLFWLAAGLSQPIYAGILGGILFFHLVLNCLRMWRTNRFHAKCSILQHRFRIVSLASLPAIFLLVYTAIGFITDPYLRIWASQNRLPAAPVPMYLLSYGSFLPFVIGGMNYIQRTNKDKGLFLGAWMVICSVLIFFPIPIQRRLIEGIWVAIILLAICFFEAMSADGKKRSWFRVLIVVLTLISLPSSLILVIGGVENATYIRKPIFIPDKEARGFEYLNQNLQRRNSIVLASRASSNALPAYAFVRVIHGHGPESPLDTLVSDQVEKIYQAETPDAARRDFICQQRIDYVVWGEDEKRLGDWQPQLETYLTLVYEDGDFTLFEVNCAKIAP